MPALMRTSLLVCSTEGESGQATPLWREAAGWATIANPVARQTDRAQAELEHFRALLDAYMTKKGLRSTDQRKLIVETFFRSDNHVSIEELLAQVRSQDPRVGYATVYRTLKLLTECGVANERRFGDGLTRYELADDVTHHDHLICVGCGEITEFEEPRIEELQERVARKYGFELRSHKHELYGVCPKCLTKGRGGN
jgi:Fur family transcriptional regulator, ferric uptake regulator